MWVSCSPSASTSRFSPLIRCGARRGAEASAVDAGGKKVVVAGAGWAGLSAAHHLCKQGFDVTLIESGSRPAPEVSIKGFWYPYSNIFSVIDELGIHPFTEWTKSAHYSPEGMEVEFPIFRNLPRLPTPFAILSYPQADISSSNGLRLYQKALEPLLQVGLFAPSEQCSAAATLGMLYYYILAHQQNFDAVWCRGTVQEKILIPWLESIKGRGCKFHANRSVTDLILNEHTGCISGVVCGKEIYEANAVVLAVGVSTLQSIVISSSVLKSRKEFVSLLSLAAIDVVSVKLWLDRKVQIPKAANVCFGFDDLNGWTFFDLNAIYDEYEGQPATVLEAEFYYANQMLPLKDEEIVAKLKSYLSSFIKEFQQVIVLQQIVIRLPQSATHFFPGSYKYMIRGSTTFPNVFMAGDWIINRHGSWSQEKALVTGLEAANRVVDYLGEGSFAKIIPVEEDEPHIEALRSLNRSLNEIRAQLPLDGYFL